MNKIRVLFVVLAALALAACGETGQSPSATAAGPTAPASKSAAAVAAVQTDSSTSAQPIASSTVAAAVLSGQACSLDTIDNSYDAHVTLDKNRPHAFRGWLENDKQKPAGEFQIVLAGNKDFAIRAHTGNARPDVASALKNPALGTAGFNVSANLSSLLAGQYEIRLLMSAGAKAYWCDVKKTVRLK